MDYSISGSEIIESLDLLRPPVMRKIDKTWKNRSISRNLIIQPLKGETKHFRKQIPKDNKYLKAQELVTSSTSVIVKKSERQILGRYSNLSYTSLLHPAFSKDNYQNFSNGDKPLIKVTVIPKTQQTQTGRLHRNLRRNTKKIQRTVSNHENSNPPKKLLMVVVGKKENIYEIKPSESANFSCEPIASKFIDVKNAVKGIANIKEFTKTLDMDKKKRKNKMNKINTNNQAFESVAIAEDVNLFKECKCQEPSRLDFDQNTNARASRVRIFGRVGFTEDEKYVLNCTATVDSKPITTFSNRLENSSSGILFTSYDDQLKYKEQFKTGGCVAGCNKVTANKNDQTMYFQNYKTCGCVSECNKVKVYNKESQGTQVDFSVQLPNVDTLRHHTKDQTNQCNCNTLDNIISTVINETEENTLRAYQSPLVIISVYPKQDTSEKAKIQKMPATKDTWGPHRSGKYLSNINSKREEKRQITNIGNNQGSPTSSRSPSPVKNCCIQRNKDNNQFETRITQMTKRQGSPPRQYGVVNKMIQNKGKIKQQTKSYINKADACSTHNQESMNCVFKSRAPKNVQAQLKKTLVEDYTKMLTENRNENYVNGSKNENSRVKINMGTDNGKYDLLINQGKLKTGLGMRKTIKEVGSQKYEDIGHNARKDLSLVPKIEPRRRKVSPVKHIYQTNDVVDFHNHTSTLNARDSIEISHRREISHHMKDTGTHQSAKEIDYHHYNDTEFLAPIKHYRGDNCDLPNPVERDKQIRELLGIVKGIPTTSKQEHKFGSVIEDHSVIQCFYKKTCNKNLDTGVSLYKLCSCCFDNKNEKDNQNEYCQKNIGTKPSIEKTSLYQQMILNRNIQVFLQVEQFTKQKPIILSRKQYNKVKKTIQKTISRKVGQDKRKSSMISVGEIRKRTKPDLPVECECAKYTQTKDSVAMSKSRNDRKNNSKKSICNSRKCFERQIQTIVLFDSKKARQKESNMFTKDTAIVPERRAVSSLEIRHTNVAYVKRLTFSSTNVESLSSSSFNERNNSLYTIFKGRRKTPTPNLGTSAFSLLSDATNSETKSFENTMSSPDMKVKKPFLRRLMSCLVMQSRISEKKIPTSPAPKALSVNSSVDSYHINTSLGAIEMTSSLYDTSASFYSNHTVCPIFNNKMKRGFFSSVRGFLTSRRS